MFNLIDNDIILNVWFERARLSNKLSLRTPLLVKELPHVLHYPSGDGWRDFRHPVYNIFSPYENFL